MGKYNQMVPEDNSNEKITEIVSTITSAIPYLGGPINSIISGALTKRRLARIIDFLNDLAKDLSNFKTEVNNEYIQTDDFEELFENTLLKVAEERNEKKRIFYKSFLINSMKFPQDSYDEKNQILKQLEQLQIGHIFIIKAILGKPDPNPSGISGSIGNTLDKRIAELSKEQIYELLSQLQDMRITKLTDPNAMLTAHGAEDIRGGLTNSGRKLIKYILE